MGRKDERRKTKGETGREAAIVVALIVLALAGAAQAQYRADHIPLGPPAAMKNPETVFKPNAALPLEGRFTKSDGRKTELGSLFNHGRPVIVLMVYFSCPALCGFNQDSLASAVRSGPRGLAMGKDYDVVVVSIDPEDTAELASEKRQHYLNLMGKPESQGGMTYLIGNEEDIAKLSDAIGFGYKRNWGLKVDDPAGKFAHSSGTFICTAAGRVSQLIPDLNYTPDELHAKLVAASNNTIGSFIDRVAVACGAMKLNPLTGKYESNPWFWAGTATAGASIVFVGIFLAIMWRGEWRKKRSGASGMDGSGPAPAVQT